METDDDSKIAATALPSAASATATSAPPPANASQVGVTMIAKYGKQKIEISNLSPSSTNLGTVKAILHEKTGILPKRQKLIGLKTNGRSSSTLDDDTLLSDLKVKGGGGAEESVVIHQFILMGTPEEQIFIDPSEKADLPDIIDDFDLDFNAGSEEVSYHIWMYDAAR
jgi:ubiquitin-like domain-containing CTD phosphatase 1